MMPIPKLHHHVPQYYQKGFARDGRVWVFDRIAGEYRRDQPRNVGAVTHDYSIPGADGEKDTRIEAFLAKIEDDAKPMLAALRKGGTISREDKDTLSYYLGYFYLRGPRFQRMANNIAEVMAKTLARFEFETADDMRRMLTAVPELRDDERANMDYEAMLEFAKREQYSVRINREYVVWTMLQDGVKLQNYFRQMDWIVAHAGANAAFVTTDNPLVVIPGAPQPGDPVGFRRDGLISKGAIKLFPLASEACLVMLDHGDHVVHMTMSPDAVHATNLDVVRRCERLVIGRDEAHVRSLVRESGVDRLPRTPIISGASPPSR